MTSEAAARFGLERAASRREIDDLVRNLRLASAGAIIHTNQRPSLASLWDAVEPHLLAHGITRVGDLTGLDDIGVPVWFACRPNSRSLSASQGKALSDDGARLGAVMESLEQAFAERHEDLVLAIGGRDEMVRRGWSCLAPEDFLRAGAEPDDPRRERRWTSCFSLTTGREMLTPYELVGFDLREGAPWDHASFRMSTIGLAAGPTLADAALHGALELVERDATAAIDAMGLHPLFARPVRHESDHDPALDDAVVRVRRAGLDVAFADVTGGQFAPVLAAFIAPSIGGANTGPSRVFAGFACRLDAPAAALSALLEAVQSRLTFIAGARDDLLPPDYVMRRSRLPRLGGKPLALHEMGGLSAAIVNLPATNRLAYVVDRLIAQGTTDVFIAPLGGVPDIFSVVRVMAPGLAATTKAGAVRLGMSALKPLLATMAPAS